MGRAALVVVLAIITATAGATIAGADDVPYIDPEITESLEGVFDDSGRSNPDGEPGLPQADGTADNDTSHYYGEVVDYPLVFPVGGDDYYYADDQYIGFWACRDGCARTHHAIDIMTDKMTEIYAVADGTVTWLGTRCCSVFLTHDDGWETWYIHLNNDTEGTDDGLGWGIAPGIEIGTHVQAGQLIGWVGDSGNAEDTAPHLHFELYDPADVVVNPYRSLREADEARGFSCDGRLATRIDTNGDHVVLGTPHNDVIVGTNTADYLNGLGGDDTICGAGGDDTLAGGAGNDSIWGGDGADSILGGGGADLLHGDAGDDELNGARGNDSIWGGDGADSILGGGGRDLLHGDAGNDQLSGSGGNDSIWGGSGHDLLDGGNGHDYLTGDRGNDSIYGGDGNDWLHGRAGRDLLHPDDGDDVVLGGRGRDIIYSTLGRNIINGGKAVDTVIYSEAPAPVVIDLAAGTTSGAVTDLLRRIEWIRGSGFDDIIRGSDQADTLFGAGGNDLILGGKGGDTVHGDAGDDNLNGGPGDDSLFGDDGEDGAVGGAGVDNCSAEVTAGCES